MLKDLSPKEKNLFFLFAAALIVLFGWHTFDHAKPSDAHGHDCSHHQGKTIEVSMLEKEFSPKEITASRCDTIVFANKSQTLHQPALGAHPEHDHYPGFDDEHVLQPGEEYRFVLQEEGTFTFHDHLNEDMHGTLIVKNEP